MSTIENKQDFIPYQDTSIFSGIVEFQDTGGYTYQIKKVGNSGPLHVYRKCGSAFIHLGVSPQSKLPETSKSIEKFIKSFNKVQ